MLKNIPDVGLPRRAAALVTALVLIAATASVAAGAPAAAATPATPDRWPGRAPTSPATLATFDVNAENVAVSPDGTIYVSVGDRVEAVDPGGARRTLDLGIENFGVGGLVTGPDGVLYVATLAPPALWLLEDRGSGDPPVTRLVDFPEGSGPNGMTVDAAGALYVADSFGGRVWRVPPGAREAEVWSDDPLLAPSGELLPGTEFPVPGANGITVYGDSLFVSNSSRGTILRVDLPDDGRGWGWGFRHRPGTDAGDDGEPAVTVYAQATSDDIAADILGRLYTTNALTGEISVVSRDGSVRTVAGPADGVAGGPTAVAFGSWTAGGGMGPRLRDARTLSISIADFSGFGGPAGTPSLQSLRVPLPGYPLPSGPAADVWPQPAGAERAS